MAEEEHKYPYQLPDGLQVSYEYAQKPSFSKARRECWLRPATFILSVALASVTLFAIVAAAVGGSLATNKMHVYTTLIEDLKKLGKLGKFGKLTTSIVVDCKRNLELSSSLGTAPMHHCPRDTRH